MYAAEEALEESYAGRNVGALKPVEQLGFYFQFLYRQAVALLMFVYLRQYGVTGGLLPYDFIAAVIPAYVVITSVVMWLSRDPVRAGKLRNFQLFIDMSGIALGLPHDPHSGLPILSVVYLGFLDTGLRFGVKLYIRQLWSAAVAIGILIFLRATFTEIGFTALDAWHVALFFTVVCYGLPIFAMRERAIRGMRDTKARLQLALEAPGMYAWSSDAPMHRVAMDGNTKPFLGVDAADFSGEMNDYFIRIHPDDRARFSTEWREFIKHGGEDFECEYRLVPEAGRVLNVSVRAKARRDAKGRVSSVSGVVWDQTEQRRQQEAMRLMEERYRVTTRSAQVGVWVWNALDGSSEVDESLRILFDFPADDAGDDEGGDRRVRLSLNDFLQIVHPEDRQRVQDELRDLIRSDAEDYFFEYRIVLTTGQVRGVNSRGTVFRDDQGKALQLAGVTWDATQLMEARRQIEQKTRELEQKTLELERKNQELDDFSYIASHDLKEPLRGIINYVNFLDEDYHDRLDVKGRGMLQKLREQARRMENLIQELLHVARVDKGEPVFEDTNLQIVLKEILASLEFGIQEKRLQIRQPQPLPVLRCDRVRVGELMRNLITNGMKYNDKPEPWIEIGHRLNGGSAPVFYVRDNGIGIPPEHQHQVFGMFQRLHPRGTYGGGTGVGLTIARKIVEMHGGRIWIDSEPGAGTTFYFTLAGGAAA